MSIGAVAGRPGELSESYRRQRGLRQPPPRPLRRPEPIGQEGEPRAMDWHDADGHVRWTGPSPHPKLLLPFTGGPARLEVEVAGSAPGADLHAVGADVDGAPVAVVVDDTRQPTRLVVDLELSPDALTILTLHTPDMFCPAEIEDSPDERRLGLAIGEMVLSPR